MMKSGIYEIVNTCGGKQYIGSAVNFSRRFANHRHFLNRGSHFNPHLQAAWKKYGKNSFVFSVIEYVSRESLISREQFWIDGYDVVRTGYNMLPTAGSRLGMVSWIKGKKHSPETCAKISAANKGKRHSLETCQKMSDAMKGKTPWNKGKKASPEALLNQSESHKGQVSPMKGRRHTEEARRKMSEAGKGQTAWNKGLKMSQEYRQKLSESHKGFKMPEGQKEKISKALKLRGPNAGAFTKGGVPWNKGTAAPKKKCSVDGSNRDERGA